MVGQGSEARATDDLIDARDAITERLIEVFRDPDSDEDDLAETLMDYDRAHTVLVEARQEGRIQALEARAWSILERHYLYEGSATIEHSLDELDMQAEKWLLMYDRVYREREALSLALQEAREAAPSISAMVREFHEAFGLPVGRRPDWSEADTNKLRIDLIDEEVAELHDALSHDDLVGAADALADIAYVVYGAADTWGIPLDAVVAEVHRSNMTKLGEDGKPIRREDGKVLKGSAYEPPNIKDILTRALLDHQEEGRG